MNAHLDTGLSRQAERIAFLRQQRADLQHHVDHPLPAIDGRSRAARKNKLTRENLGRIDDILRNAASNLIAGTYWVGLQ